MCFNVVIEILNNGVFIFNFVCFMELFFELRNLYLFEI